MPVTYSPYVPAARGSTTTIEGENAAVVAEKVLQTNWLREKLDLNALAGYHLHGLHLGKAEMTDAGLTRTLTVQWQAMQTVPQERKGEHNPVETKTVLLQHGKDDAPDAEWEWVADGHGLLNAQPFVAEQKKEKTAVESADPLYGYYINLDERGDFYADVRNVEGRTVFEIHAGISLDEDESSIFEDGFMRDKHDISGLTEYLRDLGVIPQGAEVLLSVEFERRLDAADDDELSL